MVSRSIHGDVDNGELVLVEASLACFYFAAYIAAHTPLASPPTIAQYK